MLKDRNGMLKYLLICVIVCHVTNADVCQPTDFHYEYTECDSEGGRWRVQVPKKAGACTGGTPKLPVRGKRCDFVCEKGQYLDIASDQECKSCPPGTYSLGDGVRFEDWHTLPSGFQTTAESYGHFGFPDENEGVNCSRHNFTPQGSYISAVPGVCNSQLLYSTTLVNKGYIEFEYQFSKEASALFHFTIQNEQCESFNDRSGHELQWPKKTEKGAWGKIQIELKKGLNVFKWRVLGMNSDAEIKSTPILIRKIEITGVGFISECTKCRNGTYSSGGTQFCSPCPVNTYSEYGAQTCSPCDPTTEYSMKGAGACTKRPACTKEDYYGYQLPCDKGKTQISYMWIRPQICRTDLTDSVSLPPKSAPVDCPPCNPGMQLSDNSVCLFCPDGTFSDGKSKCQSCPETTSPDYKLQYEWWNTMPANMSTDCISFSEDEKCEYNSSWIPMSDHLLTHYGHDEDAYLLLLLSVSGFRTQESVDGRQVVGSISFVFSTKCASRCAFVFLMDLEGHNELEKAWEGSQERTHYKVDLYNSGPITFSWAFQRSYVEGMSFSPRISDNDIAKIYSITVTNSLDGGAVDCQKCPKGMKNDRCVPCPAGHYIDKNSTTCKACPPNTVIRSSNLWGEENCKPCGQGLIASKDGTQCVTDCTFVDNDARFYDFKALDKIKFVKGSNLFTGAGTKYFHGFNVSLCGGDKMVTCSQNVTTGDDKSDRKSNIQLDSLSPVKGAICRSTFIPSSNGQQSLSTQPTSLGDYLTKIVSNQSLKETYEKGGFDSKGIEKDIQFYYESNGATDACPNGRSTIISLKCDLMKEDEGEIQFPPKCVYGTCDGCNFHFIWKTMYACPKCSKTDFTKIVAECADGKQQVHYTKPNNCLGEAPSVETQKCKIQFPFIVKVVVPPVALLGVVLLICVIYCWQRNKSLEYKYMKLVHNNEPNYDGELPGVDSCALSDGEEDQFDSVKFKESRGSKILNKIRGKRSNKDDENPFETGTSEKIPLT